MIVIVETSVSQYLELTLTLMLSCQDAVWSGVVEVVDQVLLPALSLLQCNCGLAEELWSLLRLLPYQMR